MSEGKLVGGEAGEVGRAEIGSKWGRKVSRSGAWSDVPDGGIGH